MNIRTLIPLLLAWACLGAQGEEEGELIRFSDQTTSEEIEVLVQRSEFIKIDVSDSDVSWGKFVEIVFIAAVYSREIVLHDGVRALSLSFTREWMKKIEFRVSGQPERQPSAGMVGAGQFDAITLVACEFDCQGNRNVQDEQGRTVPIEEYLAAIQDQSVVIVCYFPNKTSLKTAFREMFKLLEFENVIDFTFTQDSNGGNQQR